MKRILGFRHTDFRWLINEETVRSNCKVVDERWPEILASNLDRDLVR